MVVEEDPLLDTRTTLGTARHMDGSRRCRCRCLLCCSAALMLALIALATAAAQLVWAWDQASLEPLAEPALLEAYLGCDAVTPMLERALEPLKRARTFQSANILSQRKRLRLPRVQIIGSKLHITCPRHKDCMRHEARLMLLLLRITSLPDVDFLFDSGENTCHHTLQVPVVATETAEGCDNLLAPPRALHHLPDNARWLARATRMAWGQRRNVALFRGQPTGGAPRHHS